MRLIVKKEDELLEFLYQNLDMPKKRIKQYLDHGSVYVNNNKVTQYNYRVLPGMKIVVSTSNQKTIFPFDILFEDEHIIAVNKPSGLLTIATSKEKEKTLYHIVREYLISKNKNAKVFIVHRLDKDTSGIIILAKDEKTKNILQKNWNEYVKIREYVAVVLGNLEQKSGTIIQKLKETKTNYVYASKNDGKEAITNYQVIKENNNYSLLSINIETGRKNQIRVALSTINHPIVGDKKYGTQQEKRSRLFLHANRLKFYHPYLKKDILLETSVPSEFKKLINER